MASFSLVVDVLYFFNQKISTAAAHLNRWRRHPCQRHTRYFISLHRLFMSAEKAFFIALLMKSTITIFMGIAAALVIACGLERCKENHLDFPTSIFLLLVMEAIVQLTSINISFHLIRHDILSHHQHNFMLFCHNFTVLWRAFIAFFLFNF